MKSFIRWLYKRLNPEEWKRFNWELDKNQSVEDACFVVFDTETTGLDLKRDELISIGAVKVKGLRIDLSESFYALVRPSKVYTDSIKVHGITPKDLEEAKNGKEVCLSFLDYSRGCVFVGYFIHLDIAMVGNLLKKECGHRFFPQGIDLLDMVERKDNVQNMEELLKSLKLPTSTFHNALEDAYMTALAFLKLLKDGRYKRIKDLPLRVY